MASPDSALRHGHACTCGSLAVFPDCSDKCPGLACHPLHGLRGLQKQWQEELEAQMDEDDLDDEQKALLAEIRSRRSEMVEEHRRNKSLHGGNSIMPRSRKHSKSIQDMEAGLGRLGVDTEKAASRMRSASAVRQGRKRERSIAVRAERQSQAGDVEMEAADEPQTKKRVHSSRSRSMSRGMLASCFGLVRIEFAVVLHCASCWW